jgi:hypothetical protein
MRPESLDARVGGIRFGDVASDETTGDVAALVFHLFIRDSVLMGEAIEATGEYGPPESLADLHLDVVNQTIQLAHGAGKNRSTFSGRLSCDSIWGRWEPYPNQVREAMVFRRMK